MQLHPTRATFHVALAGSLLIALGIVARLAAPIAFGGAMILSIAIGRALALATVTRLRASGFEMVWSTPGRVNRIERGGTVVLTGELRNRSPDDARGVRLRPLASSMLTASIEPSVMDLPGSSKVTFEVRVRADRVGRWGLHGVSLEVRGTPLGGEGLFEVPLMFANPQGIEVLPKALSSTLRHARGGRSRISASARRSVPLRGDGDSLKELREHMPGDPFKRIAWRASARRGQLLVREMERDEREVVLLILDASVELLAGELGRAPLDLAIDEVAGIATRHLGRGDLVGLVVFASRVLIRIEPATGRKHAADIAEALLRAASASDSDRSELDEGEVSTRVFEHLRPLDPGVAHLASSEDLSALAERAMAIRTRAPFKVPRPFAPTPREQELRHYLAAFGIETPPRILGEHVRAAAELASILGNLAKAPSKRPSMIYIWAPLAPESSSLTQSLRALRRHRTELHWRLPDYEPSLTSAQQTNPQSIEALVQHALKLQVRAKHTRIARMMRGMGIRLAKPRPVAIEGTTPARARHEEIDGAPSKEPTP